MTEKLKTLKDLKCAHPTEEEIKSLKEQNISLVDTHNKEHTIKHDEGCVVGEFDLRQEAIKWIKLWQNTQKTILADEKMFDWFTARIDAFKEFFNITDEEIK